MLVKNKEIINEYITIYSLVDRKIGIPIFQRFYAWKEDQIIKLLEDIENAYTNDKQLYLLDFIYYEENGKIMLADGQQRIVTLNLLIKAIKDLAKENNISLPEVQNFDISYDILVNDKKYQDSFNNYVSAPFKNVYLALLNFLRQNQNHLEDIIKIITTRIYIYFKKCASVDDAFLIFQQINTGGKPLSKDEIIKTALDQYSQIYDISINTVKIRYLRQNLISYYKYVEDDYTANFDNMAIMSFLNKYVTKDKESFKKFKESMILLDKLEDNPFKYIFRYIDRPSLNDVLNIMMMKSFDLKNNKEYTSQILIPLCMLSITLTLNGGNPVLIKYLTNELIRMIKEDTPIGKISFYIAEYINSNAKAFKINLKDFTSSLGYTESNYRDIKKALLILDVVNRNTSGTLNVKSINLEHIYPQKPNYTWALNGWPTSVGEQNVLIDNIGNYLLLNEPVNKKIKNKYITDKLPEYQKIIPKDLMLQTAINTVDFIEFEKSRDKYIVKRQHTIAERLREDLPFGKVLITK